MKKFIKPLFLVFIFSALYGCASGMVGGGPGVSLEVKASGHAYLVDKQAEEQGYGLYSYLLFGSRPNETNRNLYLEAIKAVIKRLSGVKELEAQGFSRAELNVTYVLLKKPLPPGEGGPSPEWVLENYNYARAKFFLSKLPETRQDGPYIVSTLNPIARLQRGAGEHLVQDLSAIPPARTDIIQAWIKAFLRRATQPRKWDSTSGEKLTQKLRLVVAIAAEGLPQVQEAIKTWVVWVKDLGLTQRPKTEKKGMFYSLEA